MEKAYRVVFVYPDGHIEETQELFKNGREALDYGNSLLAQVHGTESVINRRPVDDIFEERQSTEPYFMIVEVYNRKFHLVYDSRNR